MSIWSCEDFDTTTDQDFSIMRPTYVDKINIKMIKFGTVTTGATFKIALMNDTRELFNETVTAAQLNALSDNTRFDVSISMTDTVLTENLDGTANTYTLRFSSTGYTSSATSQVLLVRRAFDDLVYPITGLPTGFPSTETASAYPIFIEFFTAN